MSGLLTSPGLLSTIPSYLYQQYQDDDNLQSFVLAYNAIAQQYLDWFNTIGLPVYTGAAISGPLLDWVGNGLYGTPRPVFGFGKSQIIGPLNTYPVNSVVINARKKIGATTYAPASDDIYKRVITWNFYKGDGLLFTIPWLKRRIQRFISGANGVAPTIDNTYAISIVFEPGTDTIQVGVPNTAAGVAFQTAAAAGVLNLPFQITLSVNSAVLWDGGALWDGGSTWG